MSSESPHPEPLTNRRDLIKFLTVAGIAVGAAGFGIYEDKVQNDPAHYVGDLEANPVQAVRALGELEERDNDRHLFDGVMQFLQVLPSETIPRQAKDLEAAHRVGLYSINMVDLNGLNLNDPKTEKPIVREYFESLFGELNTHGLAPGDVGTFVLCPEFVVGYNGVSTEYVPYLNMFLEEIKQVGPSAKTSNMVDLAETVDLLDKLPNVNTNLLDQVGIQALANSDKITFDEQGQADISDYLSTDRIEEVVNAIGGNKPVWLNTGIIRADQKLGVEYSLKQRIAIAEATANVVRDLQQRGIDIGSVNLFAENELNGRNLAKDKAGRDFSFHSGEDEKILTIFAKRMLDLDVELSGYAVPHDMLKTGRL